jgi:thioredoxin 1
MEVERVVAPHSSTDYGLLGTGSPVEVVSTPEAGTTNPAAGTDTAAGVHSNPASTPDGTQAGNAADTTEKPTYLIYFTATWCGPCRSQKPVIEEIKAAGKYKVYIVDIDNDPNTAAAWGVTIVPTVATVLDGKTTYRGQGAGHTRPFLESKLEK